MRDTFKILSLKIRSFVYKLTLTQTLCRIGEFCLEILYCDVTTLSACHALLFLVCRDVELTTMWASTNNEYAVLSTVPPGSKNHSQSNIPIKLFFILFKDVSLLGRSGLNGPDQAVPHLCQATFDSR